MKQKLIGKRIKIWGILFIISVLGFSIWKNYGYGYGNHEPCGDNCPPIDSSRHTLNIISSGVAWILFILAILSFIMFLIYLVSYFINRKKNNSQINQ